LFFFAAALPSSSLLSLPEQKALPGHNLV